MGLAQFADLTNIHPPLEEVGEEKQREKEKKKKGKKIYRERKIKICFPSDEKAELFSPMATQLLDSEEGRVWEVTAVGNGWGLLIFLAACSHTVLGVM